MSFMAGVYLTAILAVVCLGAFTAFVAWLAEDTRRHRICVCRVSRNASDAPSGDERVNKKVESAKPPTTIHENCGMQDR